MFPLLCRMKDTTTPKKRKRISEAIIHSAQHSDILQTLYLDATTFSVKIFKDEKILPYSLQAKTLQSTMDLKFLNSVVVRNPQGADHHLVMVLPVFTVSEITYFPSILSTK